MADNYIEKQYEQYQARKAAWEKERKYGKKKIKSTTPSKPQQPESPTEEGCYNSPQITLISTD